MASEVNPVRRVAAVAAEAPESRIDRLDRALKRVERGLHPTCEKCGRRIEMDQLRQAPESTLCALCEDKSGRRTP